MNETSEQSYRYEKERKSTCNLHYMSGFSEDVLGKMIQIRAILIEADSRLREILNPSRETSLVWTKLEEACMWAIKGLCLDATFKDNK